MTIAELAMRLHMPVIGPDEIRARQAAFDLIPYAEAARRACVALRGADGPLWVVLGDPFNLDTQDWIEERLSTPFRYRLASREHLDAYLAAQEAGLKALDNVKVESAASSASETPEISFEAASESDSTVVRLVSSTLYDALKAGASDVHLESTAGGLAIKYRVDGVLTAAGTVPGTELAEQVISRIKVMSELDIAERRVPQDGRFKAQCCGFSTAGRSPTSSRGFRWTPWGLSLPLRKISESFPASPTECCSSPGRRGAARPRRCTR
jgi:general secretion pathway protein E